MDSVCWLNSLITRLGQTVPPECAVDINLAQCTRQEAIALKINVKAVQKVADMRELYLRVA